VSDAGIVYICDACRERVDPGAQNVVRLIRWEKVGTFGPDVQWVEEGLGRFFHVRCAPRLGLEWRQPQD
jgi:hypothetical protein